MTCGAWQDHLGNRYRDVFVSPERCTEIVAAFMAVPRPIQLHQDEIYNPFCSHYTLKLKGKWRSFAEKLTREEAVFALWPLLNDPDASFEASAIIMAKLKLRYTDGHVYNVHPKELRSEVWKSEGETMVRECRFLSRQALGVGQFWVPHRVLFDFDGIVGGTDRGHSIETLRKLLSTDSVTRDNPQEVRRVLEAAHALNAIELTNELVRLFFYDLDTGRDFRLPGEGRYRSFWKPLSKPDEWKEHPDWTPDFPEVAVPRLLAKVAGKDALPLVFEFFSKTPEQARLADIGGGYAEVIVIRYLMDYRLHLSRKQCLVALDEFLSTHKSLPDDRRNVLTHLRSTLISGRYQATNNALVQGWFGTIPFDYRVLSNGDVIIGKEANERFLTFLSLPGWIGTLDAEAMAHVPGDKRIDYPGKDKLVERYYYLSAIPLDDSEKDVFHKYRKELIAQYGGHLHAPESRMGDKSFFYELELERYYKSHDSLRTREDE